jgi:hypothetical protein
VGLFGDLVRRQDRRQANDHALKLSGGIIGHAPNYYIFSLANCEETRTNRNTAFVTRAATRGFSFVTHFRKPLITNKKGTPLGRAIVFSLKSEV